MADPSAAPLPDFWASSGFHLLRRNAAGHLEVTDEFLGAYLQRPEMQLVAESDAAEQALHARLAATPRAAVGAAELAALGDPDACDNYRVFLDFRDRLIASGTLEAAYLGLVKAGAAALPPLLFDHLAHAILRNVLADCDDPIALRAAELLFRSQRVRIVEGAVMLADEETVALTAQTGGLGSLGRLLIETLPPAETVALDVLAEDNGSLYWTRSDRFDTVLDLSFSRPGLDALCRVLELWVAHFLGVRLEIAPVREIRDEHWSWHVGLDAESSAILDALYRGESVPQERLERLISLFRANFVAPGDMRSDLAGKPVYLALARDDGDRLRLKPQNLLVNLPLARET
jgi:Family of unknown function (DUF6352)